MHACYRRIGVHGQCRCQRTAARTCGARLTAKTVSDCVQGAREQHANNDTIQLTATALHLAQVARFELCVHCRDAVIVRQSRWPMPMVCKSDTSYDWFHSMQQVSYSSYFTILPRHPAVLGISVKKGLMQLIVSCRASWWLCTAQALSWDSRPRQQGHGQ